ncbi:hypothetical protein NPIRD3C_1217 [Nitrosopumilus piranensis]|uniref:Uncharacterized protein n=1 Tax=Nitrosopumilus piranensis TaxID=1582439 RepID=A0A0C5BW04_9ARCH|nr:hypothetical protein NPIRD3C_1217 [Nitrosopumilus piranensis]
MGRLLKARKRAQNKVNSANRIKRDIVKQGGRFISSNDRSKQQADQQLKDASLNDPVAQINALENQFVASGD